MNLLKKIVQSFFYAGRGVISAFRADQSFRLEIVIGAPVFSVIAWLLRPMTTVEILLLWGSYAAILAVELLNTAIERLLERLHPDEHELIGSSKDIAAAAVLVTLLFAGLVAATFLWARFAPASSIEVPIIA